MEKVDYIRKQTEIIEKAQRVAKDVSKVTESSVANGFGMYFNEMDDNTTKTDEGNAEEGKAKASDGKAGKLAIYFKVSSNVLAAKMTMYQKLFNEYFKFCHWYIKQAGGPGFALGKPSEEQKPENQSASSDGVQKFN